MDNLNHFYSWIARSVSLYEIHRLHPLEPKCLAPNSSSRTIQEFHNENCQKSPLQFLGVLSKAWMSLTWPLAWLGSWWLKLAWPKWRGLAVVQHGLGLGRWLGWCRSRSRCLLMGMHMSLRMLVWSKQCRVVSCMAWPEVVRACWACVGPLTSLGMRRPIV